MASTNLPELLRATSGRDHIKTHEFATAFSIADQTVRKNYCLNGECFGIRPIKVGKALLWPVSAIESLLNGGAK